MTDSKGRRVRVKHPAKMWLDGEQTVLWDDIRTAPRLHMQVAFQNRRQGIVSDCRQLKADCDSYNDANPTVERCQPYSGATTARVRFHDGPCRRRCSVSLGRLLAPARGRSQPCRLGPLVGCEVDRPTRTTAHAAQASALRQGCVLPILYRVRDLAGGDVSDQLAERERVARAREALGCHQDGPPCGEGASGSEASAFRWSPLRQSTAACSLRNVPSTRRVPSAAVATTVYAPMPGMIE